MTDLSANGDGNEGDIKLQLTAVYLKTSTGYVGFIQELPAATAAGSSMEETAERLAEALRITLTGNRAAGEKALQGKEFSTEALTVCISRQSQQP